MSARRRWHPRSWSAPPRVATSWTSRALPPRRCKGGAARSRRAQVAAAGPGRRMARRTQLVRMLWTLTRLAKPPGRRTLTTTPRSGTSATAASAASPAGSGASTAPSARTTPSARHAFASGSTPTPSRGGACLRTTCHPRTSRARRRARTTPRTSWTSTSSWTTRTSSAATCPRASSTARWKQMTLASRRMRSSGRPTRSSIRSCP
mmetsp:Transcript_3478/g.10680  ORF Transcript_3478/g.10680 Transcript_3478/m.10680 type:complete len:206 (-) Transcript_3478:196-813(-)